MSNKKKAIESLIKEDKHDLFGTLQEKPIESNKLDVVKGDMTMNQVLMNKKYQIYGNPLDQKNRKKNLENYLVQI